ncbi:hypothetical protein [Streptomyces sp. NPDC058385]|uniref:hypothetical protein n=1 Tax=Streptomyces sp. NPDC058385 TaxID=3346473 RepID=UPI00364943AA
MALTSGALPATAAAAGEEAREALGAPEHGQFVAGSSRPTTTTPWRTVTTSTAEGDMRRAREAAIEAFAAP